jgi:hypothetical protein
MGLGISAARQFGARKQTGALRWIANPGVPSGIGFEYRPPRHLEKVMAWVLVACMVVSFGKHDICVTPQPAQQFATVAACKAAANKIGPPHDYYGLCKPAEFK